jgi:transmembrane sensor
MKQPQPPLDRAILEAAAEWFIEINADTATSRTRAEFDSWLRRSPEHVRAYLGMLPAWEEGSLQPNGWPSDLAALAAEARAADNVVELSQRQSRQPDALARPFWPVAVAAAAVIACVGLSAVWLTVTAGRSYSTGTGEQRSIVLADGTVIELDARSSVRVRFSRQQRQVELLQGQALFQVQKDLLRPFMVRSGTTLVRVVGTEFDMYRKSGDTTVSVVEGRVSVVKVAQSSPLMLVSAGQQVVVPESLDPATAPTSSDPLTVRAWTQHRLVFQSTPLIEVVAEFNRYNVRQMVLRDASLGNVLISGVFSSTQPASLLSFLREQPGVAVEESSDEIQVVRK